MLVVWGTNISINYGNEYFDYEMDRPGMVEGIERDIKAREKVKREMKEKAEGVDGIERKATEEEIKETVRKEFGNEKIMGSTSRIIHDGTFPAYASLLCAAFVQALLLAMILISRQHSHSRSYVDGILQPIRHTPFQGLALQIGGICTFLSHSYVGPPFRLHYHGLGEFVSALFLAPVAALFGMVGHYTASTGRSVSATDLLAHSSTDSLSGFSLDKQLWYMLAAFYSFEQARILIMHIHDIPADKAGGKITFVVRIGYDWAKRLYVVFNIISAIFFLLLARTMMKGEGLIMQTISPSKILSGGRPTTIVAGLGALAAFAVPIIVITAKSLYYHSPSNQGKPHTASTIPILPHADLAKIVSLQTLLSPLILSIAFLVVPPK
jgi:1,4-dihydroxy-2-naphthoate octaprenyltransferase